MGGIISVQVSFFDGNGYEERLVGTLDQAVSSDEPVTLISEPIAETTDASITNIGSEEVDAVTTDTGTAEIEPSTSDVGTKGSDTSTPAVHVGGGPAFGYSILPGQTGGQGPCIAITGDAKQCLRNRPTSQRSGLGYRRCKELILASSSSQPHIV